ncbi:MAG: T9SS type A sorting domain-containing protein [Flavobacteriales bacterium]|nr:T9SS type A sorting domain-containing protein [Flavobacteriales bacterium]
MSSYKTHPVWPNPSAGTLSVALPEGWTVSTQYQVHNALGALVSSGTLPMRCSRSRIPGTAGVYLLTLQQGGCAHEHGWSLSRPNCLMSAGIGLRERLLRKCWNPWGLKT